MPTPEPDALAASAMNAIADAIEESYWREADTEHEARGKRIHARSALEHIRATLAAQAQQEQRLTALLGDRARLGGMVVEAWENGTRPLVAPTGQPGPIRYMDSGKLGHHLAALILAALDAPEGA